jgi:hypothetical protein
MMGGVLPETCWAINQHWNNKFYYTVASCWFFLWYLYFIRSEHSVLYTYYVERCLNFSLSVTNSWRKIFGKRSEEYRKYWFTDAVIKLNLNLCVSWLHLTTFRFAVKL